VNNWNKNNWKQGFSGHKKFLNIKSAVDDKAVLITNDCTQSTQETPRNLLENSIKRGNSSNTIIKKCKSASNSVHHASNASGQTLADDYQEH